MHSSLAGGQVHKWSTSQSPAATLSRHRPAGPTWPQHTHPRLTGGQSQGAGEGPGQVEALLLPTVGTGQLALQEALLMLLLGLGLLLGARGMPLTLLALAFCLHPWA